MSGRMSDEHSADMCRAAVTWQFLDNYVRLASRASSRVGVYLFVTRMMHVPKLIPLVLIVCYSTVHRIVTLGTTALDGATHAENPAPHRRTAGLTARPGRHGRRGAACG